MAYIKRAAEDTAARVSKMFPVLLITGPRQVGKTTLLQKLAEEHKEAGVERKYVTLDMSGAIFESYVFSEIYKSYLNAGKEPPVFYYRDKEQKEIDLLIYQNGVLSPIEIKKAASPGKGAIKNFHVLDPVSRGEFFGGVESLKTEIGTGSVICMAGDLLPVDAKNWYVPVWLI